MVKDTEQIMWKILTKLEKFLTIQPDGRDFDLMTPEERAQCKPYEVVEVEGNLLLNEGITELLNLLIGAAATAYNNSNARIGVGNSSTAAAASQTALQGGSTAFAAMEASYPAVTNQSVAFRSVFASGVGNFAWEEWTVDNGSSANKNLNRKVSALGTKVSGTSWQLTVTITIS